MFLPFYFVDEQRKHYLNISYALAKRSSPVREMVVKTSPQQLEDGVLQSTEFKIRSTGRQVYGSTKDFPFHDVEEFAGFKR